MKRLLMGGADIPNLRCIQWGTRSSPNALDYEGLVLDCRKLAERPPPSALGASPPGVAETKAALTLLRNEIVNETTRQQEEEKLKKLPSWADLVSDAPDAASAKGVLIASAFRNDPPDTLPPAPDRRIFVNELERPTARYHLALLDVRELYGVATLKRTGQIVDKSKILSGLSSDGVVRFQV
jgi:hypothetical protein